ncbi:MAG: dipeptide epimerase [Bacteroidota bacterium]|nr:dipeptide epimerase [Bacteroidota bacterium]
MKLKFHPFDLKLRHTFKINHGSRNEQPTLIVSLQEGEFIGYGEAAANSYYNVTVAKMMEDIGHCREIIESFELNDPEILWAVLNEKLQGNPFALCAVDIAAHDLYGKLNKKPLYELWGLDVSHLPLTNFTIGIDTIENMVAKMQQVPWPLYKIKLGTPDDIEIVKELRKHTHALFRVDANGAWDVEETINNSMELKKLNVEFIEQPLKASDMEGIKDVFNYSVLPIIADESCLNEADVEKCHLRFHGINIKLTKCGGFTPARRMIAHAKKLGMAVMMGCMTESTVGVSAVAQLLPLLDYVDMDGPLLLEKDIATGVKLENGKVLFPEENGTGVNLL